MRKIFLLVTALAVMFGLALAAPAANANVTGDKPSAPRSPKLVDADSKKAQKVQAAENDGDVDFELHLNAADADSAGSHFDYSSRSVVKSDVNDQGQIVLTPVNKPSAHWQAKWANKCPTVSHYPTRQQIKNFKSTVFRMNGAEFKKFKRASMTEKVIKLLPHGYVKATATCFQLPAGKHFPDTGLALNGEVQGMDNVVRGPPMLFEIARVTAHRAGESTDAYVPIRRGQADANGVYSIGDCGNKKPAVVTHPQGSYEYMDNDVYWWRDSGDVLARVHFWGTGTISEGTCKLTLNYDFFAQGSAAYDVLVKGKTAIEAHQGAIKLISMQAAYADAFANAEASVKVDLTANFEGCDTPPNPPTYEQPSASGRAQGCVNPGQQDGVITATGTNPNAVAAPGTLVVGGKTKQFASVGAGQTVTWDFSGFAPATYNGSFTLGSPINKSATFTVKVEPCDEQPSHQGPTAEIFVGEHAVDVGGTMPVFGRVKAFDGATATLGSPVVSPSDLGGIYNWRTVSTERDGVTLCETGYTCYQGYFRVKKEGTPGTYVYGTLTATANDTKGGSFTTQPLQFSVYYADHPDT